MCLLETIGSALEPPNKPRSSVCYPETGTTATVQSKAWLMGGCTLQIHSVQLNDHILHQESTVQTRNTMT
jgi:hypothetical protein